MLLIISCLDFVILHNSQQNNSLAETDKSLEDVNSALASRYKTIGRTVVDGETVQFDSAARLAATFTIPSSITAHDFYCATAVNPQNGWVQGTIINSRTSEVDITFHDCASTTSTRQITYQVQFIYADK